MFSSKENSSFQNPANFTKAKQHFQDIIDKNKGDTPEAKKKREQAERDLYALEHPYERDASGNFLIYSLAPQNRPADAPRVPDEAFAVWGDNQVYRPGGYSDRGGLDNATSQEDEGNIMVMGNDAQPYHYEGMLEELNAMLKGKLKPEVQFEHNFKDMKTFKQIYDVFLVRALNKLHDAKVPLGAPTGPAAPNTKGGSKK